MITLNSVRFGVVWISELREHVNTWLISTKNAVRSSNSSRATTVLLRYLRRIDPAVLRPCVSLRESSDVVDIRTSFRLSTASFNRDMRLKISTASFLSIFVHIFCELCGRYAANVIIVYICFPTGAGEICTSNLAQGQAAARVPDKPRQAPMYVTNRGRRGTLNVHLQAGLLSNQVARCLMGQAIDQTV